MDESEDSTVDAATPPVFVDDTGRRRTLTRRAGRLVALGFVGYLSLLAAGFARDPRIGAIGLPTFGLPQLVHPQAPPVVLSESTTQTTLAGDGELEASGPTSGSSNRAGGTPKGSVPTRSAGPTGGTSGPAAGTHAPAAGTSGPAPTTTTTSTAPASPPGHANGNNPTSTTTSTTTTTTTTPPGQGNSGSPASSAQGPDGGGAPGQLRKTTTTTNGHGAVG